MGDAGSTPEVIEEGRRLSESYLWQILRNYFKEKSLDAWKDSKVPFHVTSNPYIAYAYAQVVNAFLQDVVANGETPAQPLPIVDLGAGSGAFAFQFLNQFLQLRKQSHQPAIPFVYVMTDFVAATVDGWQHNPQLRPYVEAGVLDFACFDPLRDSSLTLRNSERTLSAESPTPLVAVANYFFDSLPQDLFGFENGRIFEIGVSMLDREPKAEQEKTPSLDRFDFHYVYRPVKIPYYDDSEFDRLLQSYARSLDGEVVRFPVGPMTTSRLLRALSGNDLLLIAGDRGFVHAEELRSEQVTLLFNVHDGAFSMPVNLHAIGEYLCHEYGSVLRPPRLHRSLCVSAFLTQPAPQRQLTHNAFQNYVADFGPDDISTLTYRLIEDSKLTVASFISLLRLTRHDPVVLKRVLPLMREQLKRAIKTEVEVLVTEIARAWANYYHQQDSDNLPFDLGVLMERWHRPQDAIFYYRESQRYYGDRPETLFNLASCLHQLGENHQALSLLTGAEQLEFSAPALVKQYYHQRIATLRHTIQPLVDNEF